jgi:hypothetical protein
MSCIGRFLYSWKLNKYIILNYLIKEKKINSGEYSNIPLDTLSFEKLLSECDIFSGQIQASSYFLGYSKIPR